MQKHLYKMVVKLNGKMLVFKHNQHQIDEAKQMAKDIGFKSFKEVYTPRFF